MHALRTRTSAFYYASQRLPKTVSALPVCRPRPFTTSGPVLESTTPHTPDTYRKDEEVNPPASSKTHVVSELQDGSPRTQRPFESPNGSYASVDFSKPYDAQANDPKEDSSKLSYGGTERGGGGPRDVQGSGNPQDAEGKKGRR